MRSNEIWRRPLSLSERTAIHLQDVEAEGARLRGPNRFRESPHPRVTFAKRLLEAPGAQPAQGRICADHASSPMRDQVKKARHRIYDEVSVF